MVNGKESPLFPFQREKAVSQISLPKSSALEKQNSTWGFLWQPSSVMGIVCQTTEAGAAVITSGEGWREVFLTLMKGALGWLREITWRMPGSLPGRWAELHNSDLSHTARGAGARLKTSRELRQDNFSVLPCEPDEMFYHFCVCSKQRTHKYLC